MRWIIAMAALVAACTVPATGAGGASADIATLMARGTAALEAERVSLIALRRDIHRNPELSNEEVRTASLVAARLEALGFEVRRGVGGHGVVGVLRGGRPGRVVAFRADMDAVRDSSPDPVEFRSERPGVRHICGHDIHTTIGMALAQSFAAMQDQLPGTIVLYFQPAEEVATGAQAMIAAGAMDAPRPDIVFGLHTAPFEVGTFVTAETVLMAIRDRAVISVSGDNAGDISRGVVLQLGELNTAPPFAPQPTADPWINVDAGPQQQHEGAVRTNVIFNLSNEAARRRARTRMDSILEAARVAHPSARIEARYEAAWTPGIQNDPTVVRGAVQSIREELGDSAIRLSTTVIPAFSEDFGHMQARAPGAFFFIGVSNSANGWVGMPHSPNYVADEEAIFVGARAMTRVMLDAAVR